MTVFQPVRRATLLIPTGPVHDLDRKHLFIILTDSIADPLNGGKDSVLLTSLSTLDTALPYDPTCILHPGDHPFVTRDSYVKYYSSRIQETSKINNGVATGEFVAKGHHGHHQTHRGTSSAVSAKPLGLKSKSRSASV